MEDHILDKIKNLDKRYKAVAWATLVWGMLAHGFIFFNKVSYRDDVHMQDGVGATFSSGRWGLGILEILTRKALGTYSLTTFNGLVTLVLIGLACAIMVKSLDIKSATASFLLTGLVIVFPAMTVLYSLMFTTTYYGVAIVCAFLGVYLTVHSNKKWLGAFGGMLAIGFSLGIYQAYIGFPVATFMILVVKKLTEDDVDVKAVWREGVRYVVTLAGGLTIYMVVNKISLMLTHTELSDYQGLSSMYSLGGLGSILARVKLAYVNFCFNLDASTAHTNVFVEKTLYVYALCLVVIVVCCAYFFFRHIKNKNYVAAAGLTVVMLLFPLGINIVYMMGATYMYQLMLHAKVLVFVLMIVLLDNVHIGNKLIGYIKVFLLVVLLYANVFYAKYANRCYQFAWIEQSKSIQWFSQLAGNIKSVDGFDDDYKIVYIGEPAECDKTFVFGSEFNNLQLMAFTNDIRFYNSWRNFMRIWTGFEMQELEEDRQEYYKNLEVVSDMPCYPDTGSISIVDDVVIVKFQ